MNYKSNRFFFQLDTIINILYTTLDSGVDIGQGINVRSGKIDKKNKHRALNK